MIGKYSATQFTYIGCNSISTSAKQKIMLDLLFRYKHYEEQLNKTKVTNRESEKEFVAEINDIR